MSTRITIHLTSGADITGITNDPEVLIHAVTADAIGPDGYSLRVPFDDGRNVTIPQRNLLYVETEAVG